jgi:hypothetical protein
VASLPENLRPWTGGEAKMQTRANDKPAFWKQKLQEYRKSGLSRRTFSEQNGVNKSTLDYWFARIRKEKRTKGLVEVKPTAIPVTNPTIQIVVAGKYRIEVNAGFDPRLFCAVVKTLESI